MKKERKHYSAEEKVAILRRHLLDGDGVSKLCDELGLKPSVFQRWQHVEHYNTVRLHSAIGFVTPREMLEGRQKEIHAARDRDRKLEEARRQRQLRRQQVA